MIPALGKNTPVKPHYKQRAYITREVGGLIFIYWGEWIEDEIQLPPIPMFEELLNLKDFDFFRNVAMGM